MRTLLMMIAILLLNTSWATAQIGGALGGAAKSAQQGVEKSAEKTKDAVSSLGDTNAKVRGCLSKENGSYMLSDPSSGRSYTLTGNTSQLASSVGHDVQVTGTISSGKNAPGAIAGEAEGGRQTLKVSSFKNISNTCAP